MRELGLVMLGLAGREPIVLLRDDDVWRVWLLSGRARGCRGEGSVPDTML